MSKVVGRCVRPASKSFKRTKYSIATDDTNVCASLGSGYNPTEIEKDCHSLWESNNFFRKISDKKFVMVLPPPNVTGSLHLGHALTCAVQDSIARWKQMCDHEVVWVPGCDHAGIATQVVVEKHLWATQSLTRHHLGRERFVAEVWKWRNEKGTIIYDQMRRLGVSLDWDRAVFTMDEHMSNAVTAAFIDLFDSGLVYRGKSLVNWCCALQSAISDIEIEHVELSCPTELEVPGYDEKITFGKIFDFAYKVCNSEEELVVSTTRPETMLGDTAIMVHPQDQRFQHLHGKHVQHPFRGDTIPIITDDAVDPEFGTGVVKVTPAHDPNDYEVGQRHKLPHLSILTDQGTITDIVPQFEGQSRFTARGTVLQALTDLGLYRGSKHHPMTVPRCSRTNDIIEPRIKPQWFINCKPMAKAAMAAVENGDLKIHPNQYTRDWYNWLHDTRDWCVSRQLWWGHRIPVYRVHSKHINDDGDIWVAARSLEEARSKGATKLGINENEVKVSQEEDVLDTWFSSGLFPFAVFGWPNDTTDLNRYYPTNLLETGHDILFFWVARMVMLGLQLTQKLPFKEVLLHGLVCDSGGHKMSKSRGNVIDPMDVITGASLQSLNDRITTNKERGVLSPHEASLAIDGQTANFPQGIPTCGADALRFTLCSNNIKNKLLSVDIVRMEQNKFFGNKIWQTTKFLLNSISRTPNGQQQARILSEEDRNTLQAMDLWILSHLSELVEDANKNMNSYDLHFVTSAFATFWNNYICDVYLESIKPVVHHGSSEDRNAALLTLWTCVTVGLRVLHPFMPHLTEHLHQHMNQAAAQNATEFTSIMTEAYPQHGQWGSWRDVSLENKIDGSILQSAAALRNLKATYNITGFNIKGSMICNDPSTFKFLQEMVNTVSTLGRIKSVNLIKGPAAPPSMTAAATVNDILTVHLHLKGAIEPATEGARLQKKIKKLQKDTDKLLRIVSAPGYAKKSPQHIQDNHFSKLSSLQKEQQQVQSLLDSIKEFRDPRYQVQVSCTNWKTIAPV